MLEDATRLTIEQAVNDAGPSTWPWAALVIGPLSRAVETGPMSHSLTMRRGQEFAVASPRAELAIHAALVQLRDCMKSVKESFLPQRQE